MIKPNSRQIIRNKIMKNVLFYDVSKNLFRLYCSLTHFLHVYPDYLIIGAAKCGTSSLHDYLLQHPNTGQSLTKQIHFFDRYYNRKISWYKVSFPFVWTKFFTEKIKRRKFVTGEATPHYMTHPLAAQRASLIVPNAKIIVMLRNPVDRAYSHYHMEKAHNKEELTFEEAISQEPERIKDEIEEMLNNKNNSGRNYPHRAYIKSGEYLEQIKKWRDLFPQENFLFIDSAEFNKNPSKVYNDTLRFLGLSPYELEKYKKIRKRKYEKMNNQTRNKLVDYFRTHNKELFEYLNLKFDWDR